LHVINYDRNYFDLLPKVSCVCIAHHCIFQERFKHRLEAGDTELDPHLVWAQEVGGRKRGRYYGLHDIIDKARIRAMAKSSPVHVDKVTEKEMFTQDQVQEMIRLAAQQLNEAWEKTFQSLEQRMHSMVSPEAPQLHT